MDYSHDDQQEQVNKRTHRKSKKIHFYLFKEIKFYCLFF